MGFLARVLSFRRTTRNGARVEDVEVKPGGTSSVTLEQTGPPGDDSPPLDTDFAAGLDVEATGRGVAVGYADPKNAGQAAQGEKRFYSRDSSGDIQATIHLKGDGTIELRNASGSVTLQAAGDIEGENGGGSLKLSAGGDLEFQNGGGSLDFSSGGAVDVQAASMAVNASSSFKVDAGGASLEMAGGVCTINGAQIDAAGLITDGIGTALDSHTHIGSPSAPLGAVSPTGIPVPA